jgi:methionyl-tRNA synthetase
MTSTSSSTYVTVAIPYVNAAPHLGYAYELVLADVFARARRAAGGAVRFLGGTDDYSLKNVLAAEAAGVPTREFVDALAERFRALAGPLDLSFDDFIRTSADARHRPAVERLWRAVAARGDLDRRVYEGDYCVGCEAFVAPAEQIGGRCPDHGTPVERVAEDNWFFRLSRYGDALDELISTGRLAVEPAPFRHEVLRFVRDGLADVSVSRSAGRARGWGVPVPGDPGQVVYVWFDALANYVSALGYGDPGSADYRRWWVESDERVHVVGKGIVRFHAVFWPAFLLAAGEPLPTRIQVHPYLTAAGAKLSKSGGAGLDPAAAARDFGTDAVRWWFARDVHPTADTDFTVARLVQRANEDLAGGVGNVVNRVVGLARRHRPDGGPDSGERPVPEAAGLAERVANAAGRFDLRGATRLVVDAVAALNRDLADTEPWRVARDPDRARELDRLLTRHLASAAEIAAAVAPLVPGLAGRLQALLAGEAPAGPPAARLAVAAVTSGRSWG